ncbi:MAG: hypothetical protein QOD90_5555, partial [Mycobacterium sp.]|nr:hypothetical protein [Mycobacterium sp.]
MAKHAKQSCGQKRFLASAVTAGALAAAGAALVGGPVTSPPSPRVVHAAVTLVDYSVPIPNELLAASCAATDVICTLTANARGTDNVVAPPAFVPSAVRAPVPAPPIDPVLARLLGLPAQILANPLNVIGRGGWLIGDAVTPGANGGFLIGNGADGRTPGQNGGYGGLLVGAGGNG